MQQLRYPIFPKEKVLWKSFGAFMKSIVILENQLSHSRNNNAKLRTENDRLRDEKREFEDKYRRLLGRYQIDGGKMKIGF